MTLKILSFGNDTNLLRPADQSNEAQYRQQRYCELLDLEKTFLILNEDSPYRERTLAGQRIKSVSVSVRSIGVRLGLACVKGVRQGLKLRPHLVEYQDPKIDGLAAYVTARALGVPLVGGVFNDFLDNPTWLRGVMRRHWANRIGQFVLARSVCVRCDSADTTRSLQRKGYCQVRYVPFYVPWLDQFMISDTTQLERMQRWKTDPVILCVARLAEEKNIALLLEAFAQLRQVVSRGRLMIIGTGPLRDRLFNLAAMLNIQDYVEWLNAVEYSVLPRYYQAANLFALTSNSETSARVLILAQAARLPTITTDTSGSRDIVRDNQTGYICPVGDKTGVADRLGWLLGDQANYQRMLQAAEYDAGEKYGDRVITTQLKAFYDDALLEERA